VTGKPQSLVPIESLSPKLQAKAKQYLAVLDTVMNDMAAVGGCARPRKGST